MTRDNIAPAPLEICVCLTLVILGYIAFFVPPEHAANLPAMDEGQYTMSAWNLFNKGVFGVTLNHQDHPAHFPYGFSLLLLPAFALWGPFVGNVTYMNFLLHMGVLMLTYVVGRMVGGWMVGGIAALFLLGNSVFLHFSHRIYCQGAIAFFYLLACALLLKIQERQDNVLPWGLLIGLGITLGYLSSLHVTAVLLSMVSMVCLGLTYNTGWRKRLVGVVLVAGICAGFLAMQFEYNRRTFGGFLRSGYEYWNEVPARQLFSQEHFIAFDFSLLADALTRSSLTSLWQFVDTNNLTYYLSGLLGLRESSVLYSPVAAILIVLGGNALLKNRHGAQGRSFIICTLVAIGALLGLFIPYYYKAFRFFIPLLPVLGIAAAIGIMSLWRPPYPWSKNTLRAAIAIALGGLFVADLSYSYISEGIQHAEAEFRKPRGKSRMARYACVQRYKSLAEDNAVIVSSLDINYISHFVLAGTDRTYLPLVRQISYVERNPREPTNHWRDLRLPVAAENPHALAALLQQGSPIYTDDLGEQLFQEEYQQLRSVFDWKIVGSCASFHIYRLYLPEQSITFQ
jgi:4-amino-4-deoxy-L-arabinose transferase-like glycosyltransferase